MKRLVQLLIFASWASQVVAQMSDAVYYAAAQRELDQLFPGQFKVDKQIAVIRQGDPSNAYSHSGTIFTVDSSSATIDGTGRLMLFRRVKLSASKGKRLEDHAAVEAAALRVLERAGMPESEPSGAPFLLREISFEEGGRWQRPAYSFSFVKRPYGFEAEMLGGAMGTLDASTGEVMTLFLYRGWTFEKPQPAISESEARALVASRYGGFAWNYRARPVFKSMNEFRGEPEAEPLIKGRIARLCYDVAWSTGNVYVDSVTRKMTAPDIPAGPPFWEIHSPWGPVAVSSIIATGAFGVLMRRRRRINSPNGVSTHPAADPSDG